MTIFNSFARCWLWLGVLGLLGGLLWLPALPARADWTWNLGYQNPAGATFGLNLLYIGTTWGFETGIGWIDVNSEYNYDDDDDRTAAEKEQDEKDRKKSTSIALGGDVDLKYFLTSGTFRPFLQAGVGVGLGGRVGSDSGASAGTGTSFGGIGVLMGSKALYAYGSYNMNSYENTFVQAGLGFDL